MLMKRWNRIKNLRGSNPGKPILRVDYPSENAPRLDGTNLPLILRNRVAYLAVRKIASSRSIGCKLCDTAPSIVSANRA